MIYFYQVACVCGSYFPKYKDMFFLILVCNFIGWIKVSTDIFCVFALFLAVHLVMETTNVDKIGLSQKYVWHILVKDKIRSIQNHHLSYRVLAAFVGDKSSNHSDRFHKNCC